MWQGILAPGGLTVKKETWVTWATWVLLVPGDSQARMGCLANQVSQDIQENLWVNLHLIIYNRLNNEENKMGWNLKICCLVWGFEFGSIGTAAVSMCGLLEDKTWKRISMHSQTQGEPFSPVPLWVQLNQSVIVCCRASLPQMNIF